MIENSQVKYHAEKVIATIEKIVVSLTSSPISETDSLSLIHLGKSNMILLFYSLLFAVEIPNFG